MAWALNHWVYRAIEAIEGDEPEGYTLEILTVTGESFENVAVIPRLCSSAHLAGTMWDGAGRQAVFFATDKIVAIREDT